MKIIETEKYKKIAGKYERGKRDGTGPYIGSQERKRQKGKDKKDIKGKGKRKRRGEGCFSKEEKGE